MKKVTPLAISAIIMLCLLTGVAGAVKEIVIDDFRNGISSKWKTKSFQGTTDYYAESDGNTTFLTAVSKDSASGLYYEIDYSPEEYPFLSWSWKIEKTLEKGDGRTKEGDDYAARVYVVFPRLLFWKTRALNYVWANRLEKGQFFPNAFTANAVMVAVESGDTNAGSWVSERRNIAEDYNKAFGEPPPSVGSIAIMTDTDNTGESAKAYYGPIMISSN